MVWRCAGRVVQSPSPARMEAQRSEEMSGPGGAGGQEAGGAAGSGSKRRDAGRIASPTPKQPRLAPSAGAAGAGAGAVPFGGPDLDAAAGAGAAVASSDMLAPCFRCWRPQRVQASFSLISFMPAREREREI